MRMSLQSLGRLPDEYPQGPIGGQGKRRLRAAAILQSARRHAEFKDPGFSAP